MSSESAISLRVPSTSPVRALSLPPSSAPSTSPSPELEAPTDYKHISADHCGVCRLPLRYDHIAWSRGLVDGYSCHCGRASSEPSPPDNTPEGILAPQLGRCMLPMPEDNDDEDSEVNYEDPEEADKENRHLAAPPGFINNVPDHPFFYRIYVRNPQYTANQSHWAKERLIMAPYIK